MNTKLLFSTLICSLCFAVTAQTNAKTTVDAQTQKYQQVCKGKKQGDMISFAYKGVVFNGTCEPNEAGKLAFQPPMPAIMLCLKLKLRFQKHNQNGIS